jgi:hypothetical protein
MPQYATLSVSVKFEKGPEIKSESKFEVGSYCGLVEEQICKCSGPRKLTLPTIDREKIEMLIITADKYMSEKDCPPQQGHKVERKRIKWGYTDKPTSDLLRPLVIAAPGSKGASKGDLERASAAAKALVGQDAELAIINARISTMQAAIAGESLTEVWFDNQLTEDVKVSVLAVLKVEYSGM